MASVEIRPEVFRERQREIKRQRRHDLVGVLIVDGLAAAISFWLLIGTASVFGGALGWAGLAPVLLPFIAAAIYARRRGMNMSWMATLALPCLVLSWPIMYVALLLIAGPQD